MSDWIGIRRAYPLVDATLIEPYQSNMPVKEAYCNCCGNIVRFPTVVDTNIMEDLTTIMCKVMAETGYTQKQLAEIVAKATLDIAKGKSKNGNL